MENLKKIMLTLSLVILLPATGASMGTKPADNNADSAPSAETTTQYKPGDCFIRNSCLGNPIANLPDKGECVRRNGNSWVNERAQCVSDIDQD